MDVHVPDLDVIIEQRLHYEVSVKIVPTTKELKDKMEIDVQQIVAILIKLSILTELVEIVKLFHHQII